MRIVQLLLPGASQYEQKSQRIDFEALSKEHDITLATSLAEMPAAEVAHVYGPSPLVLRQFRRFPLPWLTGSQVTRSRFYGSGRLPERRISPLDAGGSQEAATGVIGVERVLVPEAVAKEFFQIRRPRGNGETRVAGVYAPPSRRGVRNAVDQTMHRLLRFRDDVDLRCFDQPPSPADLAGVDLWIDPAADPEDFDGFVAEAVVSGLPVVASRTPLNRWRLENGRTGWLVPPADPNELTHAILTALFKPEVGEARLEAARQTASKFRPRQRRKILAQLYGAIKP